jgi:hypothetical protein
MANSVSRNLKLGIQNEETLYEYEFILMKTNFGVIWPE